MIEAALVIRHGVVVIADKIIGVTELEESPGMARIQLHGSF